LHQLAHEILIKGTVKRSDDFRSSRGSSYIRPSLFATKLSRAAERPERAVFAPKAARFPV